MRFRPGKQRCLLDSRRCLIGGIAAHNRGIGANVVITLCVALAFIAVYTGRRYVMKLRWNRRRPDDSLRRVFRRRELRELDKALERIAVHERRHLEMTARRYVAGDAGYVVLVSDSRHGIGLGLSDGHRLELSGVSRYALGVLKHGVAIERLRPADLRHDGLSYRLVLRGEAGGHVEVFARRLTLAL
jgi:hypothetical protein